MAQGYGLGRLLLASSGMREALFSESLLLGLKVTAVLACALAAVRPTGRWSLATACGCILVLDQVTKSLSAFTNHAQALPLMILVGLAATGLALPQPTSRVCEGDGKRRGGRGQVRQITWALEVRWLVRLLVALPYTFVGINRLAFGGFDLFGSGALAEYLAVTARVQSAYGFALGQAVVQSVWVLSVMQAAFVVTTVLEAGTLLVFMSRVFRLMWLASMSLFHVGTLVMMNIFFWENLILMWVVFATVPRRRVSL
jgi:hypothetical protein